MQMFDLTEITRSLSGLILVIREREREQSFDQKVLYVPKLHVGVLYISTKSLFVYIRPLQDW